MRIVAVVLLIEWLSWFVCVEAGSIGEWSSPMRKDHALMSGVVGAVCLNLLHETARHVVPHAPRVDVLGMRALAKSMRAANQTPPSRDRLYWLTLIGDLISNSLYYSLVGFGKPDHILRRGIVLGAAAGLGAVVLPRPMGLGRQPGQQTPATQIMTFMWYFIGGLVASATARAFAMSDSE